MVAYRWAPTLAAVPYFLNATVGLSTALTHGAMAGVGGNAVEDSSPVDIPPVAVLGTSYRKAQCGSKKG